MTFVGVLFQNNSGTVPDVIMGGYCERCGHDTDDVEVKDSFGGLMRLYCADCDDDKGYYFIDDDDEGDDG